MYILPVLDNVGSKFKMKHVFHLRLGLELLSFPPESSPLLLLSLHSQSYTDLFRDEDDASSIRELDSMIEMGQEFYAESGELYRLVGVLRAADIYWNPEKR